MRCTRSRSGSPAAAHSPARLYGVGAVTATAILAELGDARRFKSSDDAVRHCGLDVTVWQSDRKRAAGHLSHQGPALLRWALFEAAQCAARRSSPDHPYYLQVANRIDHNRAPASQSRANSAAAPTTSSANSATTHSRRPLPRTERAVRPAAPGAA